jgi:hypothetical protein
VLLSVVAAEPTSLSGNLESLRDGGVLMFVEFQDMGVGGPPGVQDFRVYEL